MAPRQLSADIERRIHGKELGISPTAEELYGDFAEKWRVTENSLFVYRPEKEPEEFIDKTFPGYIPAMSDFSLVEIESAEALCLEASFEGHALSSCVFDYLVTRDPAFADTSLLRVDAPVVIAPLPIGERQLIFNEDFDDEILGNVQPLDFRDFTDIEVVAGTVDLIVSGSFGIRCSGDAGGCLELDGSYGFHNPTSLLRTRDLDLEPGSYELTFELSGTRDNRGTDTIVVSVAGIAERDFIVTNEALTLRRITFEISSALSTNIGFELLGPNDNYGPILDTIHLIKR